MYDKILKITIQRLKYLNYADRTIEVYLHYIKKFLLATGKYPQHLVSSDFQKYLNQYEFTSRPQQNQIINAIRFLYLEVLERKYKKVSFKRPRSEKKLPRIISHEDITKSLSKITNIKHKAILTLTYSIGLRVSEVINLKISDIDSSRMIIHIRNAKGKKDRIAPLSEHVLHLLREYYKICRPQVFLFNGQKSLQYSRTSCGKVVKKYLGENNHFHLLRHSCFTRLLETGTDIRLIQNIAGHKSSKTTEIYTHVSTKMLNQIQLPI